MCNNLRNYFDLCRKNVYDGNRNLFLISKVKGSEQANDLTLPPNCEGFGRIHHFKRFIDNDWIMDPLPIDPACKALSLPRLDIITAQIFQIAACNMKCWYCFVPDNLKYFSSKSARWISSDTMIEMFKMIPANSRPKVLDLSGGNPELSPEWIFNTMVSLINNGLDNEVYLWSDDVLTTDYMFKYLTPQQLDFIKKYKNYGKVACFKGYDDFSFEFNTGLPKLYFQNQFEIFKRYIEFGIDIYGYVTLTSTYENVDIISEKISIFMDELQKIHKLLPLKVVPLKISVFSPVKSRLNDVRKKAIDNQNLAIKCWKNELVVRFGENYSNFNIADINLNSSGEVIC